jgi:hypothetical protein
MFQAAPSREFAFESIFEKTVPFVPCCPRAHRQERGTIGLVWWSSVRSSQGSIIAQLSEGTREALSCGLTRERMGEEKKKRRYYLCLII